MNSNRKQTSLTQLTLCEFKLLKTQPSILTERAYIDCCNRCNPELVIRQMAPAAGSRDWYKHEHSYCLFTLILVRNAPNKKDLERFEFSERSWDYPCRA